MTSNPYFLLTFFSLADTSASVLADAKGKFELEAVASEETPTVGPGRYAYVAAQATTVAPPSAVTVLAGAPDDWDAIDEFPLHLLQLAGAA